MGCRFSSVKQTNPTSSAKGSEGNKTPKPVASAQGFAAVTANDLEWEFPTLTFQVDLVRIASDHDFQDVVDAFSADISTLSMGLPVQVAFRLFTKTVIFLTDGTDIGAKIKKLLTSKSEKIDDGVKLLTQMDLKTAMDELTMILHTSARLIQTIEHGGQDQGPTSKKNSCTIHDLLSQVRSCVHSALNAYNTAGDGTEAMKTKLHATKIAVSAKMAASIKSDEGILADTVRDLFVLRMNRLLSESVLRNDLKKFMEEKKMTALDSRTELVLRLKELVTCYLACEVFCLLNKLPSLMSDLDEDKRFDLKGLLLAGLFDGDITPYEMFVVAAFLGKSAELKDLPSQQEFMQQFSVDKTSATALLRQGCQKDALGDSAGARDLWEKAAEAAHAYATAVPKQGAFQRKPSTEKSPPPAAEGGGAAPPAAVADADVAAAAKALVRLSWERVGAGRYEEAHARCEEAAALAPGLATAHFGLGYVLEDKLGRLEDGIAAYRRAIELDPEHVLAHNNLGRALQAQGDLAGAVASYRDAVELDPEYVDAHYNLGVALAAQGDLPGCEAAYRRVLKAQPDYANALCNLGNLLRERGGEERLREAEHLLRRAVALDPGGANKANTLGVLLWQKSDLAEAERMFRKALMLDPNLTPANNNLKNLLAAKK